MNTEEYLNNLKSDYEKTGVTWHLKTSGWDELSRRIGLLETPGKNVWFRNFAVTFAVLLLFLAGTYKIALAAMPGDALYAVKILSEKIIQKATGDNQAVIDHRAEEIIVLSQKQKVDREAIEKISIEYKEVVVREKSNLKINKQSDPEFQKKLENQHSEFDKISRENPDLRDEIKDAREVSGRGNENGD